MKISRMSKAYNARPIQPEPLPLRFLIRAGPGIIEPWKSILDENTLLLRAAEHECGWKGCDAVLGSEDLLKRHVEIRRHAAQGQFRGGVSRCVYSCGTRRRANRSSHKGSRCSTGVIGMAVKSLVSSRRGSCYSI